MDIYWYGQACFKLKGKEGSVIIDPFDPVIGLKLPASTAKRGEPKDLESNMVLVTHGHKDHNNSSAVAGNPMVFSEPGEYEVKGVVVTGIQSFHDNSDGSVRGLNTIFHLLLDGLNIVHLGDLGQSELTQEQVQLISQTDILLIPIGGVYTINSKEAAQIVSQLEPKIIIPMHFKIDGLVPDLEGVEGFLKEMGVENVETVSKLSITKDKLPEEPQVVVLSKA